jgi:hypothetical protein
MNTRNVKGLANIYIAKMFILQERKLNLDVRDKLRIKVSHKDTRLQKKYEMQNF